MKIKFLALVAAMMISTTSFAQFHRARTFLTAVTKSPRVGTACMCSTTVLAPATVFLHSMTGMMIMEMNIRKQ